MRRDERGTRALISQGEAKKASGGGGKKTNFIFAKKEKKNASINQFLPPSPDTQKWGGSAKMCETEHEESLAEFANSRGAAFNKVFCISAWNFLHQKSEKSSGSFESHGA